MNDALPRRVEARDLKPGDKFEYTLAFKGLISQAQQRIDRVKPLVQPEGKGPLWRSFVTYDHTDGSKTEGQITLFTEDGQTHHGWVRLSPDAIVVLLERGAE